jgi:uncharacterized damage-inducible protein DinB
MNYFPLMARFNAWVNPKIYDCVARLSDQDYRRDRGAFFGSIHRTLNHLLVVDRMWTARIAGTEHGIRSLDQILYEDFAELRAARDEEDRRFVALVDELTPEQLQRPILYRRVLGTGTEEARAAHILLTLLNHQTHHRGQVHTMLTQSGIEPPAIDAIYFFGEIGLSGPPGTIAA